MERTPAQNDEQMMDKAVHFIEKWALFLLVLAPYWYFSYKIIDSFIHPDLLHRECGTGSFSLVILHVFLTGMAAFILGMTLWYGKGYSLKAKVIVLSLIFIPLLTSFAVFGLGLYQ